MNRRWLKLGAVIGGYFAMRQVIRARRALDVRGRLVVVMGGSRGLGLVLARELVKRGAQVAICARDKEELDRARRDLVEKGGDVFASVCDVTDRDSVIQFITQVEDDVGAIDVLINNAGILQCGPVENMTCRDFEEALDVNLRGPLHAMLAVIPYMKKRGEGRIVNIASIGGKIAVPHLAPYSTSKFALVGLSESMRSELVKDGIYVTTVCPGLMRTGSPRHAWFKGQAQKEYAWFSAADSFMLSSISAESAALQLLDAMQKGDPEITISWQGKLAAFVNGIAPTLVQELMSVVARALPGPTNSQAKVEGKNAESAWAPSVLTRNSDEAATANNERD
jgi:NAD(P)-dependent dehydrogenase (short-subunit alcohol dehydrogenase family)